MSDPKIKEVIRNHLTSLKGNQSTRFHHQERGYPRNDPDRRFHSSQHPRNEPRLHAATKDPSKPPLTSTPSPKESSTTSKPFPKPPADPSFTYIAAKYGDGPTPCYVCGKRDHGWVQCSKKKRGKCGVCGSEAHWTRHCRQRYRPQVQARLNFQTLCVEALSNPEINLMNTPFDDEEGEAEEYVPPHESDSEEQEDSEGQENDHVTPTGATMCQVSLSLPPHLHACNSSPTEQVKSAVQLLKGDVMKRWGHFLKKICVDATTSIFPISSPSRKGQLLYQIAVDRNPVVALLDHGASHSFVAKDWARKHHMSLVPLASPIHFSFFNGTHDAITHLAHAKSVCIGPHNRPWVFLAAAATPMPVVLGLDAVRGWPLFYSPLDDRLFVVDDAPAREEPTVIEEHSFQSRLTESQPATPSNSQPQCHVAAEAAGLQTGKFFT